MHGPPIQEANDRSRCCGTCRMRRYVMPTLSECRLGPDFFSVPWGTPLRYCQTTDVCSSWETNL